MLRCCKYFLKKENKFTAWVIYPPYYNKMTPFNYMIEKTTILNGQNFKREKVITITKRKWTFVKREKEITKLNSKVTQC
jgi:hypothetical protein